MTHQTIVTTKDAITMTRVLVRLEQQIERAYRETREADAASLARTFGALSYQFFGHSLTTELGQ